LKEKVDKYEHQSAVIWWIGSGLIFFLGIVATKLIERYIPGAPQ
jgi:hypothetical protein